MAADRSAVSACADFGPHTGHKYFNGGSWWDCPGLSVSRRSAPDPVSPADTIRLAAEALRDACLALERDGARSAALLRAQAVAYEQLQDLLDAETVLELLAVGERDKAEASAHTSLRVELANIFGPVKPREGQTWNAAMLGRIADVLAADEDSRERDKAELESIRALVDEQADDEGLWFFAHTAAEGYLQQELRRLHSLIEGDPAARTAVESERERDRQQIARLTAELIAALTMLRDERISRCAAHLVIDSRLRELGAVLAGEEKVTRQFPQPNFEEIGRSGRRFDVAGEEDTANG